MAPDVDVLLAPAYEAFTLASDALDVAKREIRLRYTMLQSVTKLAVVDPATGAAVATLADGLVLKQATLPTGATIAAEVSGQPCTLVFEFDGTIVRRESSPPYSVGGDGAGGRLSPWDGLTAGPHRIRVTPYDQPGGRAGESVEVRFVVAPRPVPVPVPPPIPLPPQLPLPPPVSPGGWTDLPLAAGARLVYVRADGDDGNAGDAPNRPIRTLAKAVSLMRPAAGDRILLYAGHTFPGRFGSWRFSGAPGRPAGIMAYADGPDAAGRRPVVAVTGGNGVDINTGGVHDVAFVGVRFTAADRDPAAAGFRADANPGYGVHALFPTRSVLIEDCQFDHFGYNLSFQAVGNAGQHRGLTIRRCLVLDAWGPPATAYVGQGVYLESCRDLRIVECVLDHNGWVEGAAGVPAVRNIFRHGAYLNTVNMANVLFEENVCSNNANYGVQQRCGGSVRRNVFYDNATSAGVCGDDGEVADNLIVGGHDTDAYGQGIAIELAARNGRAVRNVMLDSDGRAHRYPAARVHVARRSYTAAGPRSAVVTANVIWGCDGPAVRVDGDDLAALTLTDNVLRGIAQQAVALDRPAGKLTIGGNAYAGGPAAVHFTHHARPSQKLTIDAWRQLTGDRSQARAAAVPNPDWRLPPDYVRKARTRPRGTWDLAAAPQAMVAAAQAAFGL